MLELITASTTATPAERPAATLDDVAREGARRMIELALRVEVAEYLARHQTERDRQGHALVVRNGQARSRPITVGAGTVPIAAPRVNDRRVVDGQRQKFTSAILPPYLRRSPNVAGLLPLLYLRGLSTGDFREALPVLLGAKAAGLSPSAITRLTQAWTAEHTAFRSRELTDRDYIYLWADGVHFTIRLEEERLCALVLVGVRPDGTKELVALEDGYRESTESWLTVPARPQAPRDARPGGGHRRRRAGVLGGRPRGVAGDGRATLLGASDRQRPGQAPEGAPAAGEAGAPRDDVRRIAGAPASGRSRGSSPSTRRSTPRP